MDRVAARYAEQHGVRTVDLHALLKAASNGGLLAEDQLRALVRQMEQTDHTIFPFKEELFGVSHLSAVLIVADSSPSCPSRPGTCSTIEITGDGALFPFKSKEDRP